MITQSFHHDLLPNEPIVVATMHEDFNFARDTPAAAQALSEILDSFHEPVYYVNDSRALKPDFSSLVTALAQVTRGDLAVFKHPNIREILVVTDSSLLALAAKALQQAQYGGMSASVYGSVDEALDYARGQINQAHM